MCLENPDFFTASTQNITLLRPASFRTVSFRTVGRSNLLVSVAQTLFAAYNRELILAFSGRDWQGTVNDASTNNPRVNEEREMRAGTNQISRRNLLKAGAAVSPGSRVFAAGSGKMGVALIGCGSRGTKDAIDFLKAAEGVEMIAMADP